MDQIDSGEQLSLGDEVVTAGSSSGGNVNRPIRRACSIGQVVDIRRDANDVVQTAYLQPAADFDKLEYVLVILDYEGGLPPIEEQPVDCTPAEAGRCPRASNRVQAALAATRRRAPR
jgi:cell shape-determining protein MreC